MSNMAYFLFWFSFFFIIYTYLLYPTIIYLFSVIMKKKPSKSYITPSVSFLIVACNEEMIINAKITNCLEIDYPKDKIEFIIVSSGSTDNTEKIVSSYTEDNVKLVALKENRGKSFAINRVVPKLKGEVILFSDSRQMYEPDSVRELVANFSDPMVGGVSGELMLSSSVKGTRGVYLYWNYEKILRRAESDVHSTVGTTGAIYAIRKELFEPIPDDTILDDFVIPMNVVRKGYRVVFDRHALAWDTVAGIWEAEFARKIRTIAGNFQAFFRMRYLFSYKSNRVFFQFISHKVLRLLIPLFLVTLLVANMFLESLFYDLFLKAQIAFYLISMVSVMFSRGLFGIFGTVLVFNVSVIIGLYNILMGNVNVAWKSPSKSTNKKVLINLAALLLLVSIAGLLFIQYFMHLKLAEFFFWLFFFLTIYTYILYPFALASLSFVFTKQIKKADIQPSVSIIISAYNEEKQIRGKLDNTLSLDYPADKMEVIVASDGSTDKTDEIVGEYSDRGVRLIRLEGRVGKTETQNQAVLSAKGEILIFSDAASMYKQDAVRKLIRNFADPEVSGVAGKCEYTESPFGGDTALPTKLYWRFETVIKKSQTQLGTIAGASGLIYAIRKKDYIPLPSDIISDMVEPMMIVKQNKRFVYEDEAVAYEPTTSEFRQELRMRVRVIARGMVGMIFMRKMLNPLKYGWISIQIISHKIFRWLSPLCFIGLFITNLLLISNDTYLTLFLIQLSAYFLAVAILYLGKKSIVGSILLYIFTSAFASLVALVTVLRGRRVIVWETERE